VEKKGSKRYARGELQKRNKETMPTPSVIAFSSFKGGTAKTSTAIHLGTSLAKFHKKKVLLVDFDAQANLTTGLGFDPDEKDSLATVLQKKKTFADVLVPGVLDNVDLIPADTWLERVEVTDALASDRYSHERLKEILKNQPYDFILIDTPPSLCWLTESSLIAADHTVICATPEFYSVKGLERLSQFINAVNKRHPLNVLGVLLSFWNDRGKTNQAFLDVIEETFPGKVFDNKIRRDVKVMEAAIYGKPVFAVSPSSRAAEDYKLATQEMLARMKTN
jgi:chromosome partitioning protein